MFVGGYHWPVVRETTAGAAVLPPTMAVNRAFVAVPTVSDSELVMNPVVVTMGRWKGTNIRPRPERPGCALRMLTTHAESIAIPPRLFVPGEAVRRLWA
jgi:hypothetical protein